LLKLKGWGLRPWMEFEIDPSSGRYSKRHLKSDPTMLPGYAGFGQELAIRGIGVTLCSVFVHQQDIVLRVGDAAWSLCQSRLELTHHEGIWLCELALDESDGKRTTFRYRRKDSLASMIDVAYDNLDLELANLPAALPALSRRDKRELVAQWSAKAAAHPR
jgi:hypothetical protein